MILPYMCFNAHLVGYLDGHCDDYLSQNWFRKLINPFEAAALSRTCCSRNLAASGLWSIQDWTYPGNPIENDKF